MSFLLPVDISLMHVLYSIICVYIILLTCVCVSVAREIRSRIRCEILCWRMLLRHFTPSLPRTDLWRTIITKPNKEGVCVFVCLCCSSWDGQCLVMPTCVSVWMCVCVSRSNTQTINHCARLKRSTGEIGFSVFFCVWVNECECVCLVC